MSRRVLDIAFTTLSGPLYFCSWHLSFFGEAMGGNDDVAPVKEVQNPVVYVSGSGAEFPDPMLKQIAMRTPEIVS